MSTPTFGPQGWWFFDDFFCAASKFEAHPWPSIHLGVSKIGVPQNGWFIMENPIKMDDLGVPLFLETPILCHICVISYGHHGLRPVRIINMCNKNCSKNRGAYGLRVFQSPHHLPKGNMVYIPPHPTWPSSRVSCALDLWWSGTMSLECTAKPSYTWKKNELQKTKHEIYVIIPEHLSIPFSNACRTPQALAQLKSKTDCEKSCSRKPHSMLHTLVYLGTRFPSR